MLRADGSDELGVGFRPFVEVYVGGTDGKTSVVDAVGYTNGGHGGIGGKEELGICEIGFRVLFIGTN